MLYMFYVFWHTNIRLTICYKNKRETGQQNRILMETPHKVYRDPTVRPLLRRRLYNNNMIIIYLNLLLKIRSR